jgi:phosphatidylglycerophosphate synthase
MVGSRAFNFLFILKGGIHVAKHRANPTTKYPKPNDEGKFWQISVWSPADWVSNLRTLLTPVIGLICLLDGADFPGWWLIWLGIGFTDKIDGWLARAFGSSRRGPTNDEQSDKVCLGTAFMVCGLLGRAPWYLLALMILRDIVVTVIRIRMRHLGHSNIQSARWLGKIKTVGQFLLVGLAMYPPTVWQAPAVVVLGSIVTIISLMSGTQYAALALYATDPSWLNFRAKLGLPNWLSAFRLATALLLPYLFIAAPFGKSSFLIAVSVSVLALLTDAIDGTLAKKCNLVTDFGKLFDPIADKAAQYALALGLIATMSGSIPPWLAVTASVCLVCRDLAFSIWYFATKNRISAGIFDKIRSVAIVAWLLSLAIDGLVAANLADWSNRLLLVASVVSIASVVADCLRTYHKKY